MSSRPVAIASRTAAVQLVCSRWGLESFWRQMSRERTHIPQDIVDNVNKGVQSIKECSRLPELCDYFSQKETMALNKSLGSWCDKPAASSSPLLIDLERKWEALTALLWSCNVLDKMPAPWQPSSSANDRQSLYRLTGITPARPSSISYWIRGFEHMAEQEHGNCGIRSSAAVHLEYRRASALLWRCIMADVERIDKVDREKLGSILSNFHRGLGGATKRALADQLISFSVDDDFGLPISAIHEIPPANDTGDKETPPPIIPFSELDPPLVERLHATAAGRLEAFMWIINGDIDECEHKAHSSEDRMGQLERGVEAIWFSTSPSSSSSSSSFSDSTEIS